MVVRVDDLAAGAAALARAAMPVERRDGHLVVQIAPAAAARVTETLAAAGLWVSELRVVEHTLEERFLELTAPTSPAGRDDQEVLV
jgi:hypothetical protein